MEYNKESERMEELLQTKAFDELKDNEKQFVLREVGSEEQYNALRKINAALHSEKFLLSPDPGTLKRLKHKLGEEHSAISGWLSIIHYRVPAYIVLLLFIAVAAMYLAFTRETIERPTELFSKTMIDTVYVPARPDTVYVERVVVKYREAATEINRNKVSNVLVNGTNSEPEGVSMKEKEELENLLVAGS